MVTKIGTLARVVRLMPLAIALIVLSGCCLYRHYVTQVYVENGVYPEKETWGASWASLRTREGNGWGELYLLYLSHLDPARWIHLQNFVNFYPCDEESKYRWYFAVAEIRDPRLTRLIAGKQLVLGIENPYFVRTPLRSDLQTNPNAKNATPSGESWSVMESLMAPTRLQGLGKHYPQIPLPSWLPKDRLTSEHFVGTLQTGFLFQGKDPDQYFWLNCGR